MGVPNATSLSFKARSGQGHETMGKIGQDPREWFDPAVASERDALEGRLRKKPNKPWAAAEDEVNKGGGNNHPGRRCHQWEITNNRHEAASGSQMKGSRSERGERKNVK